MLKTIRFFKKNWTWYIAFAIGGNAIYILKFDNVHAYVSAVFIGTIFAITQFESAPASEPHKFKVPIKDAKSIHFRKTLLTTVKMLLFILFLLYIIWEGFNFYLSLGRN